MLSLRNIKKDYPAGDNVVHALDGVSLDFRKSEFVSILGPSGCGKTTLLNIVGGLDRYTDGDLVIRGKSTKEYKDRDWDNYRNHSVGFVFQSYNLIPHQSALRNVELALTLSGVSKAERRKRAVAALERVGLADQLHKRPAQMSGGQAQRVAIARALVNDPEIILADEPTGALDSETSVQVMEILKEIAHDRLIIMVTHNPELAEEYSSRIIRLVDGRVVGDTNPYTETEEEKKAAYKTGKRPSMSPFTAFSLSLNNLLTKKARTFLTSFAGSIGIIGIALIMSISQGVNAYISRVQEDTLSGYPIELQAESVDMSTMITTLMGVREGKDNPQHDMDAVYASPVMYDLVNSLNSMETTKNNLKEFKSYLESQTQITDKHASAIEYLYDVDFNIYTKDPDGKVVKSDVLKLMTELFGGGMEMMGSSSMMSGMATESLSSFRVWEQMLPGKGEGELIHPLMKEQYVLINEAEGGRWPQAPNELVLVVNKNHEVSDFVLFALGLKSMEQMQADMDTVAKGEQLSMEENRWSYEYLMGKEFKLLLSADEYGYSAELGNYTDLSESEMGRSLLFNSENAISLKIVGIVCPNDDATSTMMAGSIGYTSALMEQVIEQSAKHSLLQEQLANPTWDVIGGLPFADSVTEPDEAQKIQMVQNYLNGLTDEEKIELFSELMCMISDEELQAALEQAKQLPREQLEPSIVDATMVQMPNMDRAMIEAAIKNMSDEDFYEIVGQMKAAEFAAVKQQELSGLSPEELLAAVVNYENGLKTEDLLYIYDNEMPSAVSESTYEDNLKLLGYVDKNSPSTIRIYSATFSDKEEITKLISDYNKSTSEENVINYTDYVALMMSGISTIIDAISYVLMAFVSVSLIVSSIMIGIITYISVLERTKEIGILRAIGASKRDVSGVFNAETFIVGLCAGVIGIGITLLLLIPINAIIHALTGIEILNAYLPWQAGLGLVVLSMILTIIAGFFPSKIAAKKDPVVALRSE